MPMRSLPNKVEIDAAKYVDRTLNSLTPYDKPTQRMWYDTPNISLLLRLDRFVRLAASTSFSPFVVKVEKNQYGNSHLRARILPGGQELASFFYDLRTSGQAYSPFLRYAPHLEHLFEVYRFHWMTGNHMQTPDRPFDGRRLWADVYNDLCMRLRQDQSLRKILQVPHHNWSTTGFENLHSLNRSLDHLFSEGHDLTVYHLRLFASRTRAPICASPAQASRQLDGLDQEPQGTDSQSQTSLQELRRLRACWKKFRGLWATKPAYFPCRPAYVWSIESSLEDGYGIQLTLFFPTASLTRDHSIAEYHACCIGNYWVSNATANLGHFRLTHKEPAYFREGWIFGLIRADEVAAKETLRRTLSGLAVKDALAKPKNRPSGTYFQISHDSSWRTTRKERLAPHRQE